VVVFTELMNSKTTFLMVAALAAAALTAAPFLTPQQASAFHTQTTGAATGGNAGTAINFASPFGSASADGGNADSSANTVCAITFIC
jgi:hypothetical protein